MTTVYDKQLFISNSAGFDGKNTTVRLDTLLQDKARLFHGPNEIEVFEGEVDPFQRFENCSKNKGHARFVPVHAFSLQHLPEGYGQNGLLEFIKATADLTVLVTATAITQARPEFYPNSTDRYPFFNMSRTHGTRMGTGMVCRVEKFTGRSTAETCPCPRCLNAETPSRVWGRIGVYTATHVIFDQTEAAQTACRFFYDTQDSPEVKICSWTARKVSVEDDVCLLERAICDAELLERVNRMYTRWRQLWYKVYNNYERSSDAGQLNFIVSHPHGRPKMVSVGRWVERLVVKGEGRNQTRYVYDTCTCPGSSGAHVEILGCDNGWTHGHIHSGVNSEGMNFSGTSHHWF